jgi:hypothetical protein
MENEPLVLHRDLLLEYHAQDLVNYRSEKTLEILPGSVSNRPVIPEDWTHLVKRTMLSSSS